MLNPGVQIRAKLAPLEVVRACPVCGGQKLVRKFEIRQIIEDDLHSFAKDLGVPLAVILRCRDCTFRFKSTQPTEDYLAQHYAESSEDYLKSTAEDDVKFREDYRVAQELLHSSFPTGGTIVDVGCASGFFLESLGTNWNRYGVDLFHLAVERSRTRAGLVIQECDLMSAGFSSQSFDVICSFDVLEHLRNPTAFFHEARRLLKPGGWLLIGTGNSGSLTARLAGSRWTYLCIPEHLSFYNQVSLRAGLTRSGFSKFRFVNIHHGLKSLSVAQGWMRAVGKHWAVTICGEDIVRLRLFRQKTSDFLVPYFFDHMICIAQ